MASAQKKVQRPDHEPDLRAQIRAMAHAAREAAAVLALAAAAQRTAGLSAAAAAIRSERDAILAANARDMEAARESRLTAALLDRLALDGSRVEAMAHGLDEVAAFPDPLGTVLGQWTRPNGLGIARVRVPLGVIAIIFESRPNVTADAGGLCLRSGNAAILRPGSESFHSSRAIHACLTRGLEAAGLPAAAIQVVPTREREAVGALLGLDGLIDLVVPRGGRGLIERVRAESRIPVLAHLDGLCHTYVDA